MQYFRLEPDKRFVNPIDLRIKDSLLNENEPFVWFTSIEKDCALPDFFIIRKINQKYFCMSDRLKQLFDLYGDGYEREIPFFPTDSKKELQEFYWNVRLEKQDMLATRPKFSTQEPMLIKEPEFPLQCFQAVDGEGDFILVSLPMAEHLLRKYFNGLTLIPIRQKGDPA